MSDIKMNQATLGFSKMDITPKTSVEMVGFYRQDNKSRGILDPLYAEISLWIGEWKTD